MAKFSVVIPIYNVEEYLRQCLDSIVNQTFKDIEIICVNDGSTDNSLVILEEYAGQDSRVKILNQENAGVSEARNSGINAASGEYIAFFDSDDWVDLNTFEVINNKINEHNPDSVIFSYLREYGDKTLEKKIFSEKEILFDIEGCKRLHRRQMGLIKEDLRNPENADSLSPVWTKIYKLEMIKNNNLTFCDLKIIGTFEDGLFNIEYFKFAKKVIYLNEHFYHYRKIRVDSITTGYNAKLMLQWNNLFEILSSYISDNNLSEEFKEALNNRITLSIIGLGLNVVTSDLIYKCKLEEIKKVLKDEKIHASIRNLKIKFMPIHWKVFFVFCKIKCYLGVYLLLKIMNRMRRVV